MNTNLFVQVGEKKKITWDTFLSLFASFSAVF